MDTFLPSTGRTSIFEDLLINCKSFPILLLFGVKVSDSVLSALIGSKSKMALFQFGLRISGFLGYKSLDQSAQVSGTLDMATRRNARYTPLATDEDNYIDGGRTRSFDPRFDYTPKVMDKVPWKSIVLALFLLFLGTVLLFLALFVLSGHMPGEPSQAYGLLALGFLSFLPGFYETRNAYYAWRGAKGYRFSAIPDY